MHVLKKIVLFVAGLLAGFGLCAHPMPHSLMLLDVKQDGIAVELQWPLKEFHYVFPDEHLDSNVTTLIARKGSWLDEYLLQHFSVSDSSGNQWKIVVLGKKVKTDEQLLTGKYNELIYQLWLQPPPGISTRHFIMHYDAIMHQLITHKMLIRIAQDWDGGLSGKDSMDADLGILMVNAATNAAPPVIVNLDEGSKWKGFKNMVSLGMRHIAEGTDHLLFLLVLMLPAPLLVAGKRWGISGGTRYASLRLLKIATAFTIGHSLTLLAGAVGWMRLPAQPVEVMIAVSILIGGIHALRPVFPRKEIFIASGFGLIHGLAFSSTLTELNVDGVRMALSILGFNVGIELMQLFVILLFVPWLIILSGNRMYKFIRVAGAVFAIIASLAWIAERTLQTPNKIAGIVEGVAVHGQWIVLVLALMAAVSYFFHARPAKR
jgi:hypothetical protein